MPKADFYAGLTLAEQLEKLADHHVDHAVRHISNDEAAIIYRVVDWLRSEQAPRLAAEDSDAVWQRLGQVYSTTVPSSGIGSLRVVSVPAAVDVELDEVVEAIGGVALAQAIGSPRSLQVSLNAMLRSGQEDGPDPLQLWNAEIDRRSAPADRSLSAEENELLNRILYLPTVGVENSPPVFASLTRVVQDGTALVTLVEVLDPPSVVTVVRGAVGLFVIYVAVPAVRGVGRGLEERLYDWAKPAPRPKNRSKQRSKRK